MKIIEFPAHQCAACGCAYTFDKSDFKTQKEYVGRKETSYQTFRDFYKLTTFVECPICGQEFIISKKNEIKQ